MATPAFRAAGTAVFNVNNVVNPTALSATAPAGRSVGDLLLLVTECRSITATVATPSGWGAGPLTGFPIRSGTASGGSVYVFARIADGTASDNATPTWTGVTTGTSGDSSGARIIAWQNATVTQAGTVTSTDASSTTTVTMPAITTTAPQSLIVGIVVKQNDTAHTWTVATRTERSDDHTANGTGHGTVTCDLVQAAAGASGTSVATPSTTVASRTLAISISMRAAATTVAVGQVSETDTARRLAVPIRRVTETDTALPISGEAFPSGSATVLDDFDRADQTPPGAPWATGGLVNAIPTSGLAIVSNTLHGDGVATTSGYIPTSYGPDLDLICDIASSLSSTVQLVARAVNPNTGSMSAYAAVFSTANGGTVQVQRYNPGSLNVLATIAGIGLVVTGDQIGLRLRGSAIETWRKPSGGSWGLLARATDATYSAAGVVGVVLSGTGPLIDNLTLYVEVVAQTIAVAQATETDTAGATGRLHTKAVVQASETDTARRLAVPVGRATEADTAGATTFTKLKAIAQAASTETAGVLTPVKTAGGQAIAVAQASDTETARATTSTKRLAIGQAADAETARTLIVVDPILRAIAQASDTETAGALTHTKRLAISQASEVNTARTMVIVDPILRAIAQASDTETATATTARKAKAIGQAADTETASILTFTKRKAIGQASDAETARTTTATKLKAIAQAIETGSATALARAKALAIGQPSETDSATPASSSKRKAIAQAADTETARVTSPLHAATVAQASELDSARTLARAKVRAIAQASDTGTARELTAASGRTVLRASEEDTASATSARKVKLLAQASDTSSANALAHSRSASVGQASETDTATAASSSKAKSIAIASTAELAAAVTVRGRAGQAADTSSAGAITHVKLLGIQPALQTDSAGAVSVTRLLSAGIAFEVDSTGTLAILKFKAFAPATETDTARPMAPPPPQFADVGIALETDTARAIGSGGFRLRITTGTVVRSVTGTSGVVVRVSDEIREGRVTRPPVPTTGLAVTLAPGSD